MEKIACLRSFLRETTRDLHDTLDGAMAPLALGVDYPTFLRVQYEARLPVEIWYRQNARAGLPPPPLQTPLIANDLANLGEQLSPAPTRSLDLPALAFLGVAWAVAGSSLGNRAMLQRRRRLDGQGGSDAFLADPAMIIYWRSILPLLEAPVDTTQRHQALQGANAVFEQFLFCVRRQQAKIAA